MAVHGQVCVSQLYSNIWRAMHNTMCRYKMDNSKYNIYEFTAYIQVQIALWPTRGLAPGKI